MPTWHQPAKLDILYSSRTLLFINKPAGIIVQGAAKSQYARSSLTPLLAELPTPDVGSNSHEWRWHPLHRLDKLTTGCLALGAVHDTSAKMAAVPQRMLEAFASADKVQKEYLAIVHDQRGQRSESLQHMTSMLTHTKDSDDPKVRILPKGDRHSPAQVAKTDWMQLANNNEYSLLHMMPITGRKHQLRVQCADILRTPILGDYLYGREKNSWFMYLHCWQMTFPMWERNESGKAFMKKVTVEAPLPREWNEVLQGMQINLRSLQTNVRAEMTAYTIARLARNLKAKMTLSIMGQLNTADERAMSR